MSYMYLLVPVPRDVRLDTVESHCFEAEEAVLPVLHWDPRVVNAASLDRERLSVFHESVILNLEAPVCRCGDAHARARSHQTGQERLSTNHCCGDCRRKKARKRQ